MRHAVSLGLLLASCSIEAAGTAPGDAGLDTGSIDAGSGDTGVERDGGFDAGSGFDAGASEDAGAERDAGPPPIDAGPYDYVDVECESLVRTGAMMQVMDGRAFGGAAVVAPEGTPSWTPDGASLPPYHVELPATLRGGDYDVWIHFYTQDASHDAIYVGFAVTDLRRIYQREWGSYAWRRGNDDDLRRLFFPGVPAGAYTLYVGGGESEVRCDRIVVTNDPAFAPPASP